MGKTRGYVSIVLAVVVSFAVLLTSVMPAIAAAADYTGKTVVAVDVTGNNAVAADTIRSVIKVKAGDKFSADAIKQDMQAIYDLGYFFDVVSNFTEVPEGVKVTYTVLENPVLKNIVIKGNQAVKTDKLTSLLQVQKGQILNTKQLGGSVQAINNYYHDQGYILARVSDVAMGTDGTLTLTINEGMLEGIVVKGNQKTKDYVITREMKLKPGQPFNVKDAKRSMQRVYNLGYFEDVNMKLVPGREPNAVVLETDVTEQKTGTFSIGAGYSDADGLVGILELGDNNFRGTGDKVNIHWEFGGNASNYHNYSFGYTRPWLDSRQTSLGFTVYDMTQQYDDYTTGGSDWSTYDKQRKGFDITLGRPQGEYLQNYITFRSTQTAYRGNVDGSNHNYEDWANNPVTDPYGHPINAQWFKDNFGTTHSVTLNSVWDTRDNVFNPTEGQRVSLSTEFAGRFLGGDFDYNKYQVEGRKYFKVGSSQVLAVRGTAGLITGHVSYNDDFAVGGADTLRGYQDDQFRGKKMVAASVEYRFPVANKVQGVVFTDAGYAADNLSLGDLKQSIGVGLRVTTPIGPIRIDYAKGDQGAKTHFSFGGQF